MSRRVSSHSIYNCAHYFLPQPISPLDKTIDDLIKLKVSSSARPCRQCHCLETFPCRHLLLQLPYSLNIHRSWRSTRCHLIYSWAPSRSSGSKLSSIQASLHWNHYAKSWEKGQQCACVTRINVGSVTRKSRKQQKSSWSPEISSCRTSPQNQPRYSHLVAWLRLRNRQPHPLYPRSFPNSYPTLPLHPTLPNASIHINTDLVCFGEASLSNSTHSPVTQAIQAPPLQESHNPSWYVTVCGPSSNVWII